MKKEASMNLKEIEYIVKIAEERNVTRAAAVSYTHLKTVLIKQCRDAAAC